MFKKLGKVDFTQGAILKNIVLFALPLLAGNLFQQLYNAVDTWVVGWSGDQAAYAAVGSVGTVTSLLVSFSTGLGVGAGVVIAHYFGGKRQEELTKATHTTIALSLALSVVLAIVGFLITPAATYVLFGGNGEPQVVEAANEYLRIYMLGLVGLFLYNACEAILRAVGDSLRPFYFLVITTVLNTALDILFVFLLRWGVKGVALATIVSEYVSAVLCFIVLLKTNSPAKIIIKKIRFHKEQLKRIVLIGLPTAIQSSITSFGNLFLHSYMSNAAGNQVVNLASYTTEGRVDRFVNLVGSSFASALSTFVAQNLGANQRDRAKKGIVLTSVLTIGVCAVLCALTMIFPRQVAGFFNPDPEVVEAAATIMLMLTPFRTITVYTHLIAASMRGSGNSVWPAIAVVASYVVVRQIYLAIVTTYISNTFQAVLWSLPVTWVLAAIIMTIMISCGGFGKKAKFRLLKEKKETNDANAKNE